MKKSLHVIFAGGGTGGHLFPGLAAAAQLAQQLPNARITFAGSGKPFEREQVGAAGFDYLPLACRPVPSRARDVLSFLFNSVSGYATARRFLAQENASAVVGLGGYASVPMGYAASRRGLPLVLLEQNATAGRATRWLAGSATAICLAMAAAQGAIACCCPVYLTGNPIRNGFRPSALRGKHLFILGGSGGARSLNQRVPRVLRQLGPALASWHVVHQTGRSDIEPTLELYRELGISATVVDFIADMPGMLAETALAVCRAGGTTLAELAAAGVPAILLPYPHAADDHQLRNADVFDAAGAAITLDERVLPQRFEQRLAASIAALLANLQRRAAMSAAMLRLARRNAAADVAAVIRSMVAGAEERQHCPARRLAA